MERRRGPLPGNPGTPADYNVGVYGPQPGGQQSVQIQIQQPAHQCSPQQGIQPPNQMVLIVQPLPTDVPGQMLCPYCQKTVVTEISYKTGSYTWTIFGMLAIMMCWFCCCIPFCVDSCKDVEHSCPLCNNVLHIHKRMK